MSPAGRALDPRGQHPPRAARAQAEAAVPGAPAAAMPLRGSSARLCDEFDVALLDLDGVVYVGRAAVPAAPAALDAARAAGMRVVFVTNNASRTPEAVAAHLRDVGVAAVPADVVTSAQAAAAVLRELLSPGDRVLVVGAEGLVHAVKDRGLIPVVSADDDPAAVVQGFGPDVGWRQLAEAAYAIAHGVPWVASNADLTLPTERGFAPGNGALVGAVSVATGRTPVVAGKPELPLHREALIRSGGRRPLVVGDRLDTDVEGARRAGTESLLVLSGVTDVATLLAAPGGRRPTYLARDLSGLLDTHPAPSASDGAWTCGRWSARVESGSLVLRRDETSPRAGDGTSPGTDDALDALRAACAAAWSTPGADVGGVVQALDALLPGSAPS